MKRVIKSSSTRDRIADLEDQIDILESHIENGEYVDEDELADMQMRLDELKEQLNFAWQDDEAEWNYARESQEFNPDGSLKLYSSKKIDPKNRSIKASKKPVKAARYREQASQYIKWLAAEAQLLADVCKVADDPQAVLEVVNNGGSLWEKKRAEEGDIVNLIKGLAKTVADLATEYLENDAKDKTLPQVKEKIFAYLRTLGAPLNKTKNDWSSDSYVIVPADEAEFKDLNRICKELTDQFGIKWDTPLSGSWTGHNGVLDGVNVHVSIERDYEFDPSGKGDSIQIYF